MATISHKTLSGTQLHEPKGIASATVGTAYIADGAGSGSWQVQRSLGRGYIDGCILSNSAGDVTNDISISAGVCRDSTNTVDITVAAMTTGKRLDANWTAGDTNGMRNSGAAITNTTYHIYAVAKVDGTQDIYAHTSTTVATVITALQAETGGTSYVYARRIGSIIRASAAILPFTHRGDEFELITPVRDINEIPANTSAKTITLASVPTGLTAYADLSVIQSNTSVGVYLSSLTQADLSPSFSAAPLASNAEISGVISGAGAKRVWTNTSSQIRYRSNDATSTLVIVTNGWRDTRGKDA